MKAVKAYKLFKSKHIYKVVSCSSWVNWHVLSGVIGNLNYEDLDNGNLEKIKITGFESQSRLSPNAITNQFVLDQAFEISSG